MDYQIKTGAPEKQTSACLVVTIPNGELSATAKVLNKASKGHLETTLKLGDLSKQTGKTLLLHHVPGIKAKRVLLVSTPAKNELTTKEFLKIIQAITAGLKSTSAQNALLYLCDCEVKDKDSAWQARQAFELILNSTYQYDAPKAAKKKDGSEGKKQTLKQIQFGTQNKDERNGLKQALDQAQAIHKGKNLTRTLGNLPGNVCTPTYLADQAKELGQTYEKLSTKILSESQMKKLGMGSLLSVSAGSDQEAKLIIMEYKGADNKSKPQVLVGKGITFDTGGISLKPGGAMDEMKFDMCGAASVFGTVVAVAEMGLPINMIGVVAAAENMPSGGATKPGDVVTSMSGQTIEVLNTDAEGRLVLCDALTYVERYKPAAVIDIATLTGACIIALGHKTSALLSNNDDLAEQLLDAGQETLDKAWRLPLWDEYQEQLDSNFADMANIGGKGAGTITAACFLSRFAEAYPWAHLDIAGTAWNSGKAKGATGRPVSLLTQYLVNQAG